MKKIFLIIIMLLSFSPVFSMDDSSYMSLEEYEKFFELGLTEQPETQKPKLKEKIDHDVIRLTDEPIKLNIEKTSIFAPYKESYKEENAKTELFKTEKFKLYSEGTKELSDYMTNNLKTTVNATYAFNDVFSVKTGHETWYVNPDASLGSKKFYFNPRLNLNEKVYLDYISKFNQTNKNIEQEVGVNYKPSLFKDNASFGVKATTVFNSDNEVQSRRLKFSTDFYLF